MTQPAPLRVLTAPDTFRGTVTATAAAAALARGAHRAGAQCQEHPLADGGEGTVDAFGGANRFTVVTGPLGSPVSAGWRLDDDGASARAVIEMATASGLPLAGGAADNDPVCATTRGTGELIAAAATAGARHILIGVGGSATTDGGAGALDVLAPEGAAFFLSPDVRLSVCADVRTRLTDAARVFGPQKGATPKQVGMLTDRLVALRADYLRRFDIDVGELDSSGAAGGLAGGLAAIGAELVDGFAAVAEATAFDDALAAADLVITGEGRFDSTSLQGKVVGGVIERAHAANVPVVVVCGSADPDVSLPPQVTVIDITDRFGAEAAWAATEACLASVAMSAARDAIAGSPGRDCRPSP